MTEEGPAETDSRPSSLRLHALIGLMVSFWALNFLVGKIALREFPPALLAGMRTGLAGILITPVYAWSRKGDFSGASWSRSELPMLLFLGLVGVAMNQLCFIMGLGRTSVAHASLLMGLTPIFVLLIAATVRLERLTPRKILGMLVAVAGVAVLNVAPSKTSGASVLGDGFILLAACTFALFTVFGKRSTVRHGSVTVNTFAYVGGGLMLSPLTFWQAFRFSFADVSATAWASLFYMAMFPSLACYLIYYYALTYIPASRLSAFSYLQPLIATILAAVLLREPVTARLAAGGALVLAGVYVTERG